MKIISGSCRGMPLQAPSGQITRPTSARVREAVMSILTPLLEENITFIDFFAGSGAMGIEAMSRGVGRSVFVESDKNALKALKNNVSEMERRLSKQGIEWDDALIFSLPVEKVIHKLCKWPAKMIWADPPYANCVKWINSLETDMVNKISAQGAVFCLEAAWDLKDDIKFCGEQSKTWERTKERRYGDTYIGIWQRL
ncbi:MAG: RsmD family RNA methyltransferase [Oligoflexales bacterium]